MSAQFALFLKTLGIGIAVAAPVGAMAILCVERTLARGWRAGVSTGLGIATADGLYAAVAAFGVTAISSALVSFQLPLRVVGGLLVMGLGIKAMMAPAKEAVQPRTADELTVTGARGYAAMYASAIGLTLTNPMTIIAFAGVFMGAGLAVANSTSSAVVATVGVALGSLVWWLVLVSATTLVRHGITPRATVWLSRVSGALLVFFGLVAIGSAFVG